MSDAYVKPQRDSVGIVFPEMILYYVLQSLPIALKQGKYAEGHREESIIAQFRGISERDIKGCFNALRSNPPKVSLAFPRDEHSLPCITVVPESMNEQTIVLGESGDDIPYDATEVETDTVLSPLSGSVVGETVYKFPVLNISAQSIQDSIYIRRSGEEIPLFSVYSEFTIDAENGRITLATPTIADDQVVCSEYIHYTLEGGEVSYVGMQFSHVIFVDTINPLLTNFLVGLVWRDLMVNRLTLQENWLENVRISRRSLSQWDLVRPPVGFRSELQVTGLTEWTAYAREERAKMVHDTILDSDGNQLFVNQHDMIE